MFSMPLCGLNLTSHKLSFASLTEKNPKEFKEKRFYKYMLQNRNAIHKNFGSFQPCDFHYRFRTVAAAVSASFLTQSRFQLAGAFSGIPYLEAQGGVVSRRRMPRVSFTMCFQSSYCKNYVELTLYTLVCAFCLRAAFSYTFYLHELFLTIFFLTDRFRLNFTLDQTRC